MKGLFNLLHSLGNIGRAGYDPELHQFTIHHFWVVTRWYLLAIAVLVPTFFLWSKASQLYATYCVKSGDRRSSQGDHERAIRSYTTAISWRNDYPLAYHNRGLAEIALGRVEEAAKDFHRAHKLDASFPVLSQES